MEQIVLLPIPIEQFRKEIRDIVRSEINTKQDTENSERYVGSKEARQILGGISNVTLWAWKRDGKIAGYRLGGKVMFKFSELMDAAKTLKKYKRS